MMCWGHGQETRHADDQGGSTSCVLSQNGIRMPKGRIRSIVMRYDENKEEEQEADAEEEEQQEERAGVRARERKGLGYG